MHNQPLLAFCPLGLAAQNTFHTSDNLRVLLSMRYPLPFLSCWPCFGFSHVHPEALRCPVEGIFQGYCLYHAMLSLPASPLLTFSWLPREASMKSRLYGSLFRLEGTRLSTSGNVRPNRMLLSTDRSLSTHTFTWILISQSGSKSLQSLSWDSTFTIKYSKFDPNFWIFLFYPLVSCSVLSSRKSPAGLRKKQHFGIYYILVVY